MTQDIFRRKGDRLGKVNEISVDKKNHVQFSSVLFSYNLSILLSSSVTNQIVELY